MMLFKQRNNEIHSKSDKNSIQIMVAAGLAIGIFAVLFWVRDLFPLGKGSVLMIDLHSQYTPLLYRFYDVVTGQKNLFMDFSASGGAYLYADTINEILNPFNYLLLLFGRENIYLAINILLACYGTAAAVTACFCLQKLWPQNPEWNIPLSLCYAFSGFVAAQFQIIKWMYPVVLFPLFLLALRRVFREQKWGIYALLLAYQLMLSLQLGFMALLFTLFGSGFYYFYLKKTQKYKETGAVAALISGTVTGILLAAVVWLPNIVQLLHSARGEENQSYLLLMKQHGLGDLPERLYQAFHPVLFAFGAYFLWKEWRRNHKEKAAFSPELKYFLVWNAFLWFTIIAQPSNLVWHLGSYRCFPVRYAYMVLLSGIITVKYLGVHKAEQGTEEVPVTGKIRELVLYALGTTSCLAALCMALYWAMPISQGFSSLAVSKVPGVVAKVVVILTLLSVAGICLMYTHKRKERTITLLVCVTGMIYFLFILLPQDGEVRLSNESAYEEMTEAYGLQEDTTEGFLHREDKVEWPLNATLVSGGRSMTGYFPSGSGKKYAFAMEKMGYLTPWVSTRSWGGTAISDAVLAISKKENTGDVFTEGILLDKSIEEINDAYEALSQTEPLTVQNMLGNILGGEDVLEITDMEELPDDGNGNCILALAQESMIYLDAGMVPTEFTVWVNDEEIPLPEAGIADGLHRIYTLGSYGALEVTIRITDKSGNSLPLEGKKVGVLPLGEWKDAIAKTEKQSKIRLTIEEAAAKIKAEISDGNNEGTLVLPMAYTEGWYVFDGQKTVKASAVFGGILGTGMDKSMWNGENAELVFSFIPPGLLMGSCISALGILLLICLCPVKRHSGAGAENEKVTKIGRKSAEIVFVAVFCAGLLAVYIIPNAGLVVNAAARIASPYMTDNTVEQPPVRIARITEAEEGIQVDLVKENLMLKKGVRVKADSVENKDFPAEKVRDGIVDEAESRWSSENDWENTEHWLQIDLGKEQPVTCVKLYWERLNACEYALEYSSDKKEWKTAAGYENAPVEEEQTIFMETPVTTRYLRLHVWDVTKKEEDLSLYYQNVSLKEIEVYGESAGTLLIEKPQIEAGMDRKLVMPAVGEGYTLRFGGADYENLIDKEGNIADTLSDVEAELGFVLCKDGLEWELPGIKTVIPGSESAGSTSGYNVAECRTTDTYAGLAENILVRLPGTGDEELLQKMADLFVAEWKQCSEETATPEYGEQVTGIERVEFVLETEEENSLGKEGFEIRIEDTVTITANSEAGIRFGCVTLLDLVKADSEECKKGMVAQGVYRDYPRYEVRGFGIDVGRRIVTLDMLYRMVEELSLQKMNTLQIHLNDNQIITQSGYDHTIEGARNLYSGFRLESDIKNEDGVAITSGDFYYTKEEFKKFIDDAKVYGVEIVPEIDLPAHSLALTKVFPELGIHKDPDAADMLDISKEQTKQLAKDIWHEAIAVFENCDVVHIGMDEYYGNTEEFQVFMAEVADYITNSAPDKKVRAWGSLSMGEDSDLSQISRDIQLQIWDVEWADPTQMYREGFSIVNSLKHNLYIIPRGGYDRLDTGYLESTWQPNVFRTPERTWTLPAWSEKCLGACYMLWNDWSHLNGEDVTDEELYQRFEEPLEVIAEKLW